MKKFNDMNLGDQIQAIVLTKIQEYSLRLQYISNCDKITQLLEFVFDRASRAHLRLFTGYELGLLIERLTLVSPESRLSLVNKILLPFFRRNAAICMKETSRFQGTKFRKDLVKIGGVVLLTKVLLECSEPDAIEFLKLAAGKLNNGHGKTA